MPVFRPDCSLFNGLGSELYSDDHSPGWFYSLLRLKAPLKAYLLHVDNMEIYEYFLVTTPPTSTKKGKKDFPC